MLKLKKFKFHSSLISCIFLFMIISCFTIYSAMIYLPSYLGNLALKQFIWYVIGWIIIGVILKINKQKIYQYVWYIYITNVLFLFLL